MQPKYISGPWSVAECDGGLEIINDDATSVAVVIDYGDPYNSAREAATARLIAAAPELLAAVLLAATRGLRHSYFCQIDAQGVGCSCGHRADMKVLTMAVASAT